MTEVTCHLLEVDSILKSFGDYQLLTDVYLKCQTGEIVALMGRNGAGKTVLLNIIFGTMKAENKFVRLDNKKRLDKAFAYPGAIEYMPQHHFLPKGLRVGKAVKACLGRAGGEAFFENDDIVSPWRKTKISNLSAGVQRYIELKMLLLGDAKFLLLDEPFNFMSPTLAEQAVKLIKTYASGKGVIITDHNYEYVLDVATRITLLKDGVLKELTDKRGLVEQGYLLHL